jgi:hypothetical protein
MLYLCWLMMFLVALMALGRLLRGTDWRNLMCLAEASQAGGGLHEGFQG